MKKRVVTSLVLMMLALSPMAAFDGFTDIFGEPEQDIEVQADPLSIAGSVEFGIEAFRGEDEFLDGEAQVLGGLGIDLSWKGSIVDAKASLALNPSMDSQPQWEDLFTGLSLTAYHGRGFVEAGLLKKEWGSGDGVHVVDVLNAPDYRNGIVDDTLAMKVAEPMVGSTFTLGDTTMELVYKPMLIPMLVAEDTSDRWSLGSFAAFTPYFTAATEIDTPSHSDLIGFDKTQIGVRLKSILGPADVGLIYFNGFYNQPGYGIVFDYSDPSNPTIDSLTVDFTRAQLFGGEATMVAGPLTFMMEGGFWLSEDMDGDDPEKYNSKAVWLGGMGFMVPATSAYASVTYHGQQIMSFPTPAAITDVDIIQANSSSDGKAMMNTFTAALEFPMAREKVSIRLAGTYQLETAGYAFIPSVTWKITDDFKFNATGRIFGSLENKESIFKMWDGNDALKLSISYVF
jgi:hypothetical protein